MNSNEQEISERMYSSSRAEKIDTEEGDSRTHRSARVTPSCPTPRNSSNKNEIDSFRDVCCLDEGRALQYGPQNPKKGNASMQKRNLAKTELEEKSDFDCNICLSLVFSPVVTQCGHLFCWKCLYEWKENTSFSVCPLCKCDMDISNVVRIYSCGASDYPGNLSIPDPPVPARKYSEHELSIVHYVYNEETPFIGGFRIPLAASRYRRAGIRSISGGGFLTQLCIALLVIAAAFIFFNG